ncbi:MAG: hypothetical protein H6825_03030 [Planctomycetes bacterium]|nr:hypothetical protein [Planctomycetota bacterium]
MTRTTPRPPSPHAARGPSAALLVALLLLAGCAVARPEHRHLLTALDEYATPASSTARWLLVPVALPAGVGAYVIDSFVVNPVRAADDAWFDTVDLLWTSHEESTFRRILWVPFAVVLTPVVLVGDWVGRWMAPIPSRDAAERERAADAEREADA